MKKVYLFNCTPCTKLALDRTRLEDYFSANSCEIVRSPRKADLILVLTCAYDKCCEDLSMKALSFLKKYKKEVLVAGCLPEINRARMMSVHDGRSISSKDMDNIDAFFPGFRVGFDRIPDAHRQTYPSRWEKTRAYFSFSADCFRNILLKAGNSLYGLKFPLRDSACLRVSRGCVNNCSYCAIKKAVGPLKSKTMEELLREARELFGMGHDRVSLVADELGSYGLDIGENLPALLNGLVSLNRNASFLLLSLHPRWLLRYRKELVGLAREGHIHNIGCPIQSGDKRILRLMNRDMDLEELRSVFLEIKSNCPSLQIVTHAIAGFPSETREEFDNTIDFIRGSRFDAASFFHFHAKEGTAAEGLEPKVGDQEIRQRISSGIKRLRREKICAFQASLPRYR